jgi:hypothetical protein
MQSIFMGIDLRDRAACVKLAGAMQSIPEAGIVFVSVCVKLASAMQSILEAGIVFVSVCVKLASAMQSISLGPVAEQATLIRQTIPLANWNV